MLSFFAGSEAPRETLRFIEDRVGIGMLTGAQIRAARGLLNWSARPLCDAAAVSPAVLRRLEDAGRDGVANPSQGQRIKAALKAAGVEVLTFPDDRPGLRLKA